MTALPAHEAQWASGESAQGRTQAGQGFLEGTQYIIFSWSRHMGKVHLTRLPPVCWCLILNAGLFPRQLPSLNLCDRFTSVWEHNVRIVAAEWLSWHVGVFHPKKQKNVLKIRALFTGIYKARRTLEKFFRSSVLLDFTIPLQVV